MGQGVAAPTVRKKVCPTVVVEVFVVVVGIVVVVVVVACRCWLDVVEIKYIRCCCRLSSRTVIFVVVDGARRS